MGENYEVHLWGRTQSLEGPRWVLDPLEVGSSAGWDKTFYFVGADAFSQKFRPKQRDSDATKSLKNSGNLALNGQSTIYIFASFIYSNSFSRCF